MEVLPSRPLLEHRRGGIELGRVEPINVARRCYGRVEDVDVVLLALPGHLRGGWRMW